MIYFVFASTSWLKEPLTLLKGTVHKAWFPGIFFWAVTVPILINRKDVVTLLGNLSPIY